MSGFSAPAASIAALPQPVRRPLADRRGIHTAQSGLLVHELGHPLSILSRVSSTWLVEVHSLTTDSTLRQRRAGLGLRGAHSRWKARLRTEVALDGLKPGVAKPQILHIAETLPVLGPTNVQHERLIPTSIEALQVEARNKINLCRPALLLESTLADMVVAGCAREGEVSANSSSTGRQSFFSHAAYHLRIVSSFFGLIPPSSRACATCAMPGATTSAHAPALSTVRRDIALFSSLISPFTVHRIEDVTARLLNHRASVRPRLMRRIALRHCGPGTGQSGYQGRPNSVCQIL